MLTSSDKQQGHDEAGRFFNYNRNSEHVPVTFALQSTKMTPCVSVATEKT